MNDTPFNIGEGTYSQRLANVVWQAMNAPSPVTQWSCCQIIGRVLAEARAHAEFKPKVTKPESN